MMNKTILMLSASCMSFIVGADLCYAGFNPYDTPPILSPAMLKSHVSTHTSHLTAGHLSSLEDFSSEEPSYPLPKDLGRGWGGFHNTPSPALNRATSPLKGEVILSYSGLTGVSRSDEAAVSFNLDPRVKPEDDIKRNTSPLRGEGQGEGDNKNIQLAAACFVTDTTNCSGNEFANADSDDNDGGVPPGGDDYDLDNAERCRQEGYTQTSCPEGQEGSNFCPYDNDYFEKCVNSCPSNYVTCEKPYYGVGEACDRKYASCECTPCGSGYDNTTIPEGYVQDGEACLDCDGKTKYKIKPNPCDGYMDCGSMGGEAGAKTCLSGTTTMYDNCKACPNLGEYTTCPSCTICQYEECSGLWYATGCATNCTNYCNPPTTDCQALGYKRDTCSGRALKCPYDSAYVLCL